MIKKLILLTALLNLMACAFNNDNANNNAAEMADRLKQLEKFSRVVGLYTGKLTTSAAQQDVELRLFTLESEAGTNANGDERSRIVLRGNYKKINPVGPGYILKAIYYPETGELILTNESATLGVDDVHTINAKLKDQTITGEAKSISNPIGILHLKLSSNERNAPGNTEENEYYARLRRQYESIAGTYEGDNIVNGSVDHHFTIELRVSMDGVVPKLIGNYNRENHPEVAITITTAVYQPELNPPRLTLKGNPSYFGGTNYIATFEGVITGDEYIGSWETNIRGLQGDFALKKIK